MGVATLSMPNSSTLKRFFPPRAQAHAPPGGEDRLARMERILEALGEARAQDTEGSHGLDSPHRGEAGAGPTAGSLDPATVALIAQVVAQAVVQAQEPLLQAQARADERQAQMAEALAAMRREMETIRHDNQASRQFIREQNKLSDAKYLLRLPGPAPDDAAAPGA